MKKTKVFFIVSLLLIFIGSSLGNLIQTDFGKVTIKEVKFIGSYGNIIEGYLYIPKGVNKDNPAPAVINIHGYLNTKEFQNGFSIEYARRGYVVLAIDMPGHGYSDPVPGGLTGFFSGGPAAFNFLSTLDIVEKDKIAFEGHSMGGWNAVSATEIYGDKINTVVLVGSSSGTFGQQNFGPESPFNFAMIFGVADEFVALNWELMDARAVNTSQKMKTVFNSHEDIVNGKLYGSFDNKTARALYQIKSTHAGEHISKEGIGKAVEFVQNAMPGKNPLPSENQIWKYQELTKLLNLIGIAFFIFAFGTLLLNTKFFGSLKQQRYDSIEFKGKPVITFIFLVIATVIPALTYFQFYGITFLEASFLEGASWRPQGLTFSIAIWTLVNSGLMLLLLGIWHQVFAKKAGGKLFEYGLSTSSEKFSFSWNYIGKTLLLAITILGAVQTIAVTIGHIFKIDFRYWIVGFKALNFSHFRIMLVYILPFFFFYLVSSMVSQAYLRIRINENDRYAHLKDYLLTIFVQGFGMLLIVMINYGGAWYTGVATFTNYTLECIVAIQFMVLLPYSGIISKYFTSKTGNIYLGSMLNAIFITGYIVVSQAVHYYPGY